MRRFLAITTLALLAGSLPAEALGDFIINVGNANIAAGGTGTVDVTITDTTSVGDNLALTAFQFKVTNASGTTSTLAFSPTQADSGLTSPGYVFLNNSADAMGGQALGVATTPTTYTGGDNTNDFTNVKVTSSSTFLLARLDLTAFTGSSSPKAGDSFTISLVSDPNFTFFLDNQFNSTSFTSTAGTVMIVAAVPEPGSSALILTAVAAIGLFGVRQRSCLRIQPTPPTTRPIISARFPS